MSIPYYKIPLQLSTALDGNELAMVGLKQSITKNLELIITTRFGEHRCDPTFGCEIWNLDFEIIVSESIWEEKLRQSLLKSISTHELRLNDIDIAVKISEVEKQKNMKQTTEIKKRVDITLKGIIHKTGEQFFFTTNLFLSPLS
eukprot:gene40182-54332_t